MEQPYVELYYIRPERDFPNSRDLSEAHYSIAYMGRVRWDWCHESEIRGEIAISHTALYKCFYSCSLDSPEFVANLKTIFPDFFHDAIDRFGRKLRKQHEEKNELKEEN